MLRQSSIGLCHRDCSTRTISAIGASVLAASYLAPQSAADARDLALPIPQISFQGHNVNNITTDVAVGQQITLNADQAGHSRVWIVSPPAIAFGSYRASDTPPDCPDFPQKNSFSCITYGKINLIDQSTTLYILKEGTYKIKYLYTMRNGQNADATTTFVVNAPKSVKVSYDLGIVQIVPAGCTDQCYMAFGNNAAIPTVDGIKITATATQPQGIPGTFEWSQTVGKLVDFSQGGSEYQCPYEYGLDNSFPYQGVTTNTKIHNYIQNNVAYDAPYIELLPEQEEVSESFTAQTTLLWQAQKSSNVIGSIPVVLGTLTWTWAGIAFQLTPGHWSVVSYYVQPPLFTPGGYLLNWNSVLLNSYNPACPPA